MPAPTETKRLETVAVDSWYVRGIAPRTIEYSGRIFARHIRGNNLLELGPAEGSMTPSFVPLVRHLTLVDGAKTFCELLRRRFPEATVVCSLFEDYQPSAKFDNIVLGHVLEHVGDPVGLLRQVRGWLAPDGRVLAAVPNARSLHRQAAVMMGLLATEDALNETDQHHGHRRIYTPELFRNHFLQAGFKIQIFGGYWLKPLSNRQIEESWTPGMIEAFMQLGERYPDIAGEIYLVAAA